MFYVCTVSSLSARFPPHLAAVQLTSTSYDLCVIQSAVWGHVSTGGHWKMRKKGNQKRGQHNKVSLKRAPLQNTCPQRPPAPSAAAALLLLPLPPPVTVACSSRCPACCRCLLLPSPADRWWYFSWVMMLCKLVFAVLYILHYTVIAIPCKTIRKKKTITRNGTCKS